MTRIAANHPLTEEVRYFFRINPDEELSAHDCAVKFDVHPITAAHILTEMRTAGMLTSRRHERKVLYSRGTP